MFVKGCALRFCKPKSNTVESAGMHIGNRIAMISPRPLSSEVDDCKLEVRNVITFAFERSQPILPLDSKGTSRSEEHTSELQSHSDLVCRLLLEKKNETCTRSAVNCAGIALLTSCIAKVFVPLQTSSATPT